MDQAANGLRHTGHLQLDVKTFGQAQLRHRIGQFFFADIDFYRHIERENQLLLERLGKA